MSEALHAWGLFQRLTWDHVLLVLVVLVVARLLSLVVRRFVRHAAEQAPPRLRLSVLRAMPIMQLVIAIGAVVVAVPILVEPTVRNVAALVASVALALAFALKDYGASLVAGLVTVLENTYQPGDWIEARGIYGEVKSITLRAVHLVTADDSEVTIPHALLWSTSISNATNGGRSLLCVTEFYLHPDHDATAARRLLAQVAETSSYRNSDTPVTIIVKEKPWGTQYWLKAYVKESRDQFLFITDLTLRGKEALRTMGLRFAQAPYATTGQS